MTAEYFVTTILIWSNSLYSKSWSRSNKWIDGGCLRTMVVGFGAGLSLTFYGTSTNAVDYSLILDFNFCLGLI